MPTKQELDDLNNKCGWTWTTINGVNGYVVKGKGTYASASIFLPAAGDGDGTSFYNAGSGGHYWSSVPTSGAWCLRFSSDFHRTDDFGYRKYGFSVRPVQGFTEAVAEIGQAGASAPFRLDTRTGIRESKGTETLTYSSLWDGDADATVTIAQDGMALAEGLTGEGEQPWNVLKAGTYTLTHSTLTNGVVGKVETATFNFTKNIASMIIGDVTDVTYSGLAFTPIPVVTDTSCGYTLVKDTDYTLSYANSTLAGTATVTVTGKGYYTGSVTKTFTIGRRDIADAVVTLGGALTYSGQEQAQSISSVKAGGLTVTYAASDD